MKLVTVNIDADQNDLLVPLDLGESQVHQYLVGIYPDFDTTNNLLERPAQLHKGRIGYLMHQGLRIMMSSETVLSRSGVKHFRKIPETNLPIKDLYEFNKAILESDILVLHFEKEVEDECSAVAPEFVCTLRDLTRLTSGGWDFGDTVVKRLSCPGEGCVMSDVTLEEDLYIGADLTSSYYALCDDSTVRLVDPDDYLLWFGLDKSVGNYSTYSVSRSGSPIRLPGTPIYMGIDIHDNNPLRYLPLIQHNETHWEGRIYLDQDRPDVYTSIDLHRGSDGTLCVSIGGWEIYPEYVYFVVKADVDRSVELRLDPDTHPVHPRLLPGSGIRFANPINVYDSMMYSLTNQDFRLANAVRELEQLRDNNPYLLAVFLYVLTRYRSGWTQSYPETTKRLFHPPLATYVAEDQFTNEIEE